MVAIISGTAKNGGSIVLREAGSGQSLRKLTANGMLSNEECGCERLALCNKHEAACHARCA
jgi:hypothetical protein